MKTDYKNIKTVEEAASTTGITLLTEEEHRLANGLPAGKLARNNYLHYLLTIVCRALNNDWEADWNSEEEIWQIYTYVPARLGYAGHGSSCGLRFLLSLYGPSYASACCGVSLCFKSKEIADYAIKQFKALWLEYLTGII